MKKLLLLTAVTGLALSAQAPESLPAPLTGVSEAFRTYAARNLGAAVPAVDPDEEEINPNILYLPKPTTNPSRITTNTVTSAVSGMYNQTSGGTLPVTVAGNFQGLGNGFPNWVEQGLLPPDTTLAVGNNQIVQWVNVRLTVLNKATGAPLLGGTGYVNGNQIWAGLGGASICATRNQGDPILQYDRMANRWVLSQFSFATATGTASPFRVYPAAPYALCIAVSQTNDATGVFNLYEYIIPRLPDYPKLGVWTDAYYITTNDFSYSTSTGSGSYAGSRYCAFDRPKMLLGQAAGSVCFAGLSATHFGSLPGDFEGTIAPPANAAQYMISTDWFTLNAPPYTMQLRRFKPDFVTPANSTLNDGYGGATDSFVAMPFDNSVIGACGDGGGACVHQPGTTRRLDTLSFRPMYRLAYRNLGANREALVFTTSVGPTGGAQAGIQLVEIRNPGANPPQVYNNVNFNPDATNRWMGAAATDKLGNIGIGYSVSSDTINPGIRISGRLRNDIRNTVRGEFTVVNGAGNQTSSAQRWGDYSTMQVDPADDCTFWYTTQYTNASNGAAWTTRIVGFKFNSCQ
ncbi:MAG: hypothetical protein ABI806_24895 [Candidatus Solibacter sp.]